jgi:hypothetical protein
MVVDNSVMKAQQFGENLLLPGRMQPLLIKVNNTLLAHMNHKLILHQIVPPLIHCH